MKIPELFDPRLRAREAAIRQYELAAWRHFAEEDQARREGDPVNAERHHLAATTAGHWAYREDRTVESR